MPTSETSNIQSRFVRISTGDGASGVALQISNTWTISAQRPCFGDARFSVCHVVSNHDMNRSVCAINYAFTVLAKAGLFLGSFFRVWVRKAFKTNNAVFFTYLQLLLICHIKTVLDQDSHNVSILKF